MTADSTAPRSCPDRSSAGCSAPGPAPCPPPSCRSWWARRPPTRSTITCGATGHAVLHRSVGSAGRGVVAGPRRVGRGAGHPGGHQLRQRLLGRHPGHRRCPGRPAASGGVGPRLARRRSSAPPSPASGSPVSSGSPWPGPPRGGSWSSGRPASPPAGSTPVAPGPTGTPGWASCSCSCSSGWWPPWAPSTSRPCRVDEPVVWFAAALVGLLATALLLANNLRDIADRRPDRQADAGRPDRAPRRRMGATWPASCCPSGPCWCGP